MLPAKEIADPKDKKPEGWVSWRKKTILGLGFRVRRLEVHGLVLAERTQVVLGFTMP